MSTFFHPPPHPHPTRTLPRQREPARVCEMCSNLLEPLQPFLIGTASACVQPPVHDALDAVSLRSWLNNPLGGSMADELYKAANIVHAFSQVRRGSGGNWSWNLG